MGFKKSFNVCREIEEKNIDKIRKHGKNAKYLRETIEFILGRKF